MEKINKIETKKVNGGKNPNVEIISGYPDGTFRPDESVTRAEFAKMGTRLDLPSEKEEAQCCNKIDVKLLEDTV